MWTWPTVCWERDASFRSVKETRLPQASLCCGTGCWLVPSVLWWVCACVLGVCLLGLWRLAGCAVVWLCMPCHRALKCRLSVSACVGALQNAKVHHCVVGLRSIISSGAVVEDSLLMGADYYEVCPIASHRSQCPHEAREQCERTASQPALFRCPSMLPKAPPKRSEQTPGAAQGRVDWQRTHS